MKLNNSNIYCNNNENLVIYGNYEQVFSLKYFYLFGKHIQQLLYAKTNYEYFIILFNICKSPVHLLVIIPTKSKCKDRDLHNKTSLTWLLNNSKDSNLWSTADMLPLNSVLCCLILKNLASLY